MWPQAPGICCIRRQKHKYAACMRRTENNILPRNWWNAQRGHILEFFLRPNSNGSASGIKVGYFRTWSITEQLIYCTWASVVLQVVPSTMQIRTDSRNWQWGGVFEGELCVFSVSSCWKKAALLNAVSAPFCAKSLPLCLKSINYRPLPGTTQQVNATRESWWSISVYKVQRVFASQIVRGELSRRRNKRNRKNESEKQKAK